MDNTLKSRKGNSRRFPDAFGVRPDHKKFRQEEAAERQTEYDKLSVKDKLAKLDTLFGVGLGAEKQRAKLTALLNKVVPGKKEKAPVEEKK
jgi:hypothetical protein